jgi:hypothetical protein
MTLNVSRALASSWGGKTGWIRVLAGPDEDTVVASGKYKYKSDLIVK